MCVICNEAPANAGEVFCELCVKTLRPREPGSPPREFNNGFDQKDESNLYYKYGSRIGRIEIQKDQQTA